MESFFSSLKTKRTARRIYRTRDDAKADLFDCIGASTIQNAGTRQSDIKVQWSSRGRISLSGCQPNRVQLIRGHLKPPKLFGFVIIGYSAETNRLRKQKRP
jgi:hypothetical protein